MSELDNDIWIWMRNVFTVVPKLIGFLPYSQVFLNASDAICVHNVSKLGN